MNRIKILDILFWVFLVIGIVMIMWRLFGNSPTDLQVLVPFVVMGFLKIWNMNEKQIRLEMGTKNGFSRIKYDFGLMNDGMGLIKRDMGLIKGRLGI